MARIIDGVLVADEDEVLGWLAHSKKRKTVKEVKHKLNLKAKAEAYLNKKLGRPTSGSGGLIADRDGIRGKGDGPGSPDSGKPTTKENIRDTFPAAARTRLDAIEKKYVPLDKDGQDTLTRHQDKDGNFHGERQVLHEQLVNETLNKATPVAAPEFVMLGGGPAAGKSTAIGQGIDIDSNSVTVNADEYKTAIPEYEVLKAEGDPRAAVYVHEESSYLATETLRRALSDSKNAVLDGTGNSQYKKVVAKVQRARSTGHSIRAEYVTCSTKTALERARSRAVKSGRAVPETFLRATHKSVSQVVPQALKDGLFDSFNLWDTEVSGPPVKVASAIGKELTIHDQTLWQSFLDKAKE